MGNNSFITLLLCSLCALPAAHTEPASVRLVSVESEYRAPAIKYGLSPILFKALLTVESDLDHRAVNPLTLDFGIGQINYRTAESYDIDISRLTHDRAYSIDRSAFILATFQRKFASKEPASWVCRYNVGWGKLEGRKGRNCINYLRKIKLAMGEI